MSYGKLQKALGSGNLRSMLQRAAPDVKAGGLVKTWRGALRAELGTYGENLWPMMVSLAQGLPWQVTLPDGRLSAPIMPTPDVMLRAQMFLAEFQFGKAVPQTEIQKAEQEATDMEAIRAMSTEQLEAEALEWIEGRRVERLPPGTVTEAVFTVDDVYDLGQRMFDAHEEED